MKVNVLQNNRQDNICFPKKNGDVGFDLTVSDIKVVGEGISLETLSPIKKAFANLEEIAWARIDYIEYDTGVQISVDEGIGYSAVQPNSRNTKMNLLLGNSRGIIDAGYRGSIRLRYKYVFQPEDLLVADGRMAGIINLEKIFGIGDVCGQLTFHSGIVPEINLVDSLDETDRKDGGFGSTNE